MSKKKSAFEMMTSGEIKNNEVKDTTTKAMKAMDGKIKEEDEMGKPTICRVRKGYHEMAKRKAKTRFMTLQSYLEYLIHHDEVER